jgi:hypothetical protein
MCSYGWALLLFTTLIQVEISKKIFIGGKQEILDINIS